MFWNAAMRPWSMTIVMRARFTPCRRSWALNDLIDAEAGIAALLGRAVGESEDPRELAASRTLLPG